MKEKLDIADLILKRIRGTLSGEENERLQSWIDADPENKAIWSRAADPRRQLGRLEIYSLFDRGKAWSAIEDEIGGTRSLRLDARRFLSVAAGILLPLLVGGFLWIYLGNRQGSGIAEVDTVIKPGSHKAQLILSDGSAMEFGQGDPIGEIEEEDAVIRNQDNALVYKEKTVPRIRKKTVYNELRTPRGGGYSLTLADGSRVWLNAGSSLRFPVSFTDSIRRVYLEGEGYFEVSHNGKPFIVSSGLMDVRVLGTSFNVLAYPDEEQLVTTLVEGKVRIDLAGADESPAASRILNPDDQAVVKLTGASIEVARVNTSQFTSWTHGRLEFNNEDLETVMKRLARWYDFEFEFEDTAAMNYHFSARFDNTENISTILEMLELTTDVKFELQENTIVVI